MLWQLYLRLTILREIQAVVEPVDGEEPQSQHWFVSSKIRKSLASPALCGLHEIRVPQPTQECRWSSRGLGLGKGPAVWLLGSLLLNFLVWDLEMRHWPVTHWNSISLSFNFFFFFNLRLIFQSCASGLRWESGILCLTCQARKQIPTFVVVVVVF